MTDRLKNRVYQTWFGIRKDKLFAETMFHLYYSPNILDKGSVFVIINNEQRKVNTVNNNQSKQNEKRPTNKS